MTWADLIIKIVSAAATAAIGVAALIIAYQQLKLAKYRQKHDLFDRRFETFMKVREFVSAVALGQQFDAGEFYRNTIERRFLFTDTAIANYFDEVYERANKVVAFKNELERPNLPADEIRALKAHLSAQKTWFYNQSDEMFRLFKNDLSTKTLE